MTQTLTWAMSNEQQSSQAAIAVLGQKMWRMDQMPLNSPSHPTQVHTLFSLSTFAWERSWQRTASHTKENRWYRGKRDHKHRDRIRKQRERAEVATAAAAQQMTTQTRGQWGRCVVASMEDGGGDEMLDAIGQAYLALAIVPAWPLVTQTNKTAWTYHRGAVPDFGLDTAVFLKLDQVI